MYIWTIGEPILYTLGNNSRLFVKPAEIIYGYDMLGKHSWVLLKHIMYHGEGIMKPLGCYRNTRVMNRNACRYSRTLVGRFVVILVAWVGGCFFFLHTRYFFYLH